MKLLQFHSTVNRGSVGRHAENVGKVLMDNGHESWIAYGRGNVVSQSKLIKVGGRPGQALHLIGTRLFDRHGLSSTLATKKLVKKIKAIKPDVIHLRNIHGYYLNYVVLFDYIAESGIPVVWTFHDCWPFTGHCSFFDRVNCFKWETKCHECPNLRGYPASFLLDRSEQNFLQKKKSFTSLKNLTIITPSDWLTNHVKKSFFKGFPASTIRNGIDITVFCPKETRSVLEPYGIQNKKIILGVANVWDERKGLSDFVALGKHLDDQYRIILIGMDKSDENGLPDNIIPVKHTNSIHELAEYYSAADVFINPTYADNFPTTNIESLASGTPVITYNTGGSPEAIDEHTGKVVEQGDVSGLLEAVTSITGNGKEQYRQACRTRAEKLFNKEDRFMDYLRLYENLTH